MKARGVVGRGGEGPLRDPGSELLLGGRARAALESSARMMNGRKKKKEKVLKTTFIAPHPNKTMAVAVSRQFWSPFLPYELPQATMYVKTAPTSRTC